jgi:predicted branched-subunit amino acid permease
VFRDLTLLRRPEFRAGSRLVAASAPGTFCWGVVTGLALVNAGLSPLQAAAMTLLVFSGTAQLAALPLLMAGASLPLIWLTTVLSNLRFVIYSAAVAADFRRVPQPLRTLIGYLTTDTGLAAYLAARPNAPQRRTAQFLGANLTVWACWQVGTLLGIGLTGALPPDARLAFVGVLAILALVGPMLVTRAAVAAAGAAAAVAVLGLHWPYRLGMLAAIGAGIVAALLVDRGGERSR